jgi:hypothetical protein
MLRLQYISNIHLETMAKNGFHKIVRPVASTLVLAGNIGQPHKHLYPTFIEYCKRNWDDVIVIAGTKELENGYSKPLALCTEICSEWSNVHFLNNNSRYLRHLNLNFCGTTLWTERQKPHLHKEAVSWLDSALYNAEALNTNTVVVTHHLPSKLLQHSKSSKNETMSANLDEMIRWPVRAWISGYSHHQKEVRLQLDDPPTEEGEIILGVNSYSGGGNPEKTMAVKIIPPPHIEILS